MLLLLLGDDGFGRLQLRQIREAMASRRVAEQPILVVGERAHALQGDPAADGVELCDEAPETYLVRMQANLPLDCRVIPPPVGRHLFARFLSAQSGGSLTAPPPAFQLPFVRPQDDVIYLSAAAWTCPVTCTAPRVCPRIGWERTWHLPSLLRGWAREQGVPSIVFTPHGPSSGLESVSAARLMAAGRRVRRGGQFLVATAAPCHAAASLLRVG